MTFDVKKHLIEIQGGKEYLPVASRLVWFRQEHPDWGIETKPVELDVEKGYAIYEAYVYNTEGKLMAKGAKMETARGFADYLEKAETGSIGRALAVCGFGTQFAPEMDEGERIVDSPLPIGEPLAASSLSSEPAMAGSKSGATQGGRLACGDCGKEMTKGQYDYSVRAFGIGLCPACQRARVKTR